MTDFTTRDGCRIDLPVHGTGPKTLVISPGWSQTAAQYDRMIPLLGPDYTVVVVRPPQPRGVGPLGRTALGSPRSRLTSASSSTSCASRRPT